MSERMSAPALRASIFATTFTACAQPGTSGGTSTAFACCSSMRMIASRSEEYTSELQSRRDLVCRLLLEKKNHSSLDQHLHENSYNFYRLCRIPSHSISDHTYII